MILLSSAGFFQIHHFKNSFRNTIRVSNGLDLDWDQHFVGPHLVPDCLQGLSADDKSFLLFAGYLLKKFFLDCYQSVKRLGTRSEPTFCRSQSGSNCLQRFSADNKSFFVICWLFFQN